MVYSISEFLTFSPLRSPACFVETVLLALNHAGVAGEEAHGAEARLPVRLLGDDRAGEAEAHGAGLRVSESRGAVVVDEVSMADLTILESDPYKMSPDAIAAIKVSETWVAGERAFAA